MENVRYKCTGVDLRGKRFRIVTSNAMYARGINIYRGTKWISEDNGQTWKVIARIWN